MRLLPRPVAPVRPDQVDGLLRLCALDPVEGLALAQQVTRWTRWGTGDVVVLGRPGHPDGAAWATGSLMVNGLAPRPELGHSGASRGQIRALADHARPRLTRRGSVSGPVADVGAVWEPLASMGLRAREERWEQPLLAAPGGPLAARLPQRPGLEWVPGAVRAALPEEEALVLPASVAMFVGELGYDPTASGGSYARHVSWLVASRRSYVLIDDGAGRPPLPGGPRSVAFKADVGSLWSPVPGRTTGAAQLTGVWTRPDLRGRGYGRAALAAAVDAVRREHVGAGGAVSLYVNDFNAAALGLYASLGMERVGTYATMLL